MENFILMLNNEEGYMEGCYCNTASLIFRFPNIYLGLFPDLTIVGRLG